MSRKIRFYVQRDTKTGFLITVTGKISIKGENGSFFRINCANIDYYLAKKLDELKNAKHQGTYVNHQSTERTISEKNTAETVPPTLEKPTTNSVEKPSMPEVEKTTGYSFVNNESFRSMTEEEDANLPF